ncbi:hypothetical protein ACFQY7_04110 [Actinomadura luteofluorescens]|uniref:hypothetical protein n=1 Tax=Actinomadura luteofluorescens TaxID=46163 RepID=UPI0036279F00
MLAVVSCPATSSSRPMPPSSASLSPAPEVISEPSSASSGLRRLAATSSRMYPISASLASATRPVSAVMLSRSADQAWKRARSA